MKRNLRVFSHYVAVPIPEALSLGQEVGEIFLFFGCQTKNHMIYEEDIESIKKFQIRITIHVALSRQPEIPKKYVQDVIKENASIISHSLVVEKVA